jgi:hypothetical protein
MSRKCFISFKKEDEGYKLAIKEMDGIEIIDKSLTEPVNSTDEDYIMHVIRTQYLSDSTVTIHLIGLYGAEALGAFEQRFIKRELQASLWNGEGNTKNGILGVVLPEAVSSVFKGSYACSNCSGSHNLVAINDRTTVKEFSYNYYIPNGKCAHTEEERYCVLVKWDQFELDPNKYIEAAYAKRTAPIASKTKVRPQ